MDVLAASFNRAAETAYKAVMKPKEGTILTVARGMADKALEVAEQTEDILVFAEKVIEHEIIVLSPDPEMLPVLKQAGVVDSGGQGLMQVLKGVLDGLKGKEVDMTVPGAGQQLPLGQQPELLRLTQLTLNSDTAQSLLLMWKKTMTRRRSSILRPIWNPSVIL